MPPNCRLTDPTENRTLLYPIKYQTIWDLRTKQLANHWIAQEADFSKDSNDIKHLIDGGTYEQNVNAMNYILRIIVFFAISETNVMKNLKELLNDLITINELRMNIACQEFYENIHLESYQIMLKTFITDKKMLQSIEDLISNFPTIAKKDAFAKKYMGSFVNADGVLEERDIATRLLCNICNEGIFFMGAFGSVFWLRKIGKMHGLCFTNNLVSRDENIHVQTFVAAYMIAVEDGCGKSNEFVYAMMNEAVEIECEFITECLPCNLIGINPTIITKYIKYMANYNLGLMGIAPLYTTENGKAIPLPADWLGAQSLPLIQDFFASRVSEYSKKKGVEVNPGDNSFSTDADF